MRKLTRIYFRKIMYLEESCIVPGDFNAFHHINFNNLTKMYAILREKMTQLSACSKDFIN